MALLGTSGGAKELEGKGGWGEHCSRVNAVCDWFGPSDFLRMKDFPSSIKHDCNRLMDESNIHQELIKSTVKEGSIQSYYGVFTAQCQPCSRSNSMLFRNTYIKKSIRIFITEWNKTYWTCHGCGNGHNIWSFCTKSEHFF